MANDANSVTKKLAAKYEWITPGSFKDLDELRRKADEADRLKPGMWKAEGKMGRYSQDWCEIMDRAGRKYGGVED